jgi:quinol monooxygenase YgiN
MFLALLIDMRFSPDQVQQAVRLLISILGRTEAKPGCMECMVARDATDEGHVRYSEKWGSESSLHSHLRSAEFQCVLAAMDMCREEPNVTIGDLSGRKGVAYLQALRDREPG